MNTRQRIEAEKEKLAKIQKKIDDLQKKDEDRLLKIANEVGLFDSNYDEKQLKSTLEKLVLESEQQQNTPTAIQSIE